VIISYFAVSGRSIFEAIQNAEPEDKDRLIGTGNIDDYLSLFCEKAVSTRIMKDTKGEILLMQIAKYHTCHLLK
jgi:hypothetical protein